MVATGVDTSFFTPTPDTFVRPKHLAFVGSMDWMPNEDGMAYFVGEILPLVTRAVPGATLTIVGRNPTARVRALALNALGCALNATDDAPGAQRAFEDGLAIARKASRP